MLITISYKLQCAYTFLSQEEWRERKGKGAKEVKEDIEDFDA